MRLPHLHHPPPDEPLKGRPWPPERTHPQLYAAEFASTALLVFFGLTAVIALNAPQGIWAHLPMDPAWRRALTGFLFGAVGMAVALSHLGKTCGAHMNPALTFAFLLDGKMAWRDACGYGLAQVGGAVLGAAALGLWGEATTSLFYGVTQPGPGFSPGAAFMGEVVCTAIAVAVPFVMAAHKATQPFAALTNPPLFAVLVMIEGPLSGTSVNPARSLGPAIVAPFWQHQWIYVAGPLAGAALAAAAFRLRDLRRHRPKEARRAHFCGQDEDEAGCVRRYEEALVRQRTDAESSPPPEDRR